MTEHFDVVVVGAGTAGCVLAARLSEDPSLTVLLLEAGGDDRRPAIEDPKRWESNQGTDVDWNFTSTPQPETGRAHAVPRGRVLGGSGAINCLAHIRGDRRDFDEWSAQGAPGWGWDEVLPYFRRSEDVPDGDPRVRGTGGPLRPRRAERKNPISAAFAEGAVALGHPTVADLNAGELSGVGWAESLIRDGRRETTATAYLRPVLGRPNLTVVTDALVIDLDIRSGRCHGLRYADSTGVHTTAAAETVLAAGAIGSPHLLLRSGIGPAAELEAAGVATRHRLDGVGRGLHDHVLLAGIRYRPQAPLGETEWADATLFASATPGDHGPDLHLSLMPFDYHMPWQSPAPGSVSLVVGHMRPMSRGSIRITTGDPSAQPLIDPALACEPEDLDQLISGVELIGEIVETGVVPEWGGVPDTRRLLDLDRHDLERAVLGTVSSYFHLAGSCRMGGDESSVVDTSLRVHGIDGLRVADASIMPTVVTANTNAATIMIGERAAALVASGSPADSRPGPHTEENS